MRAAFVRRALDEHSRGRANHRLLIWSFLNLETWPKMFQ